MRKLLITLSTLALVAVACPVHAEQRELLGTWNAALKLGVGAFTDEYFKESDHTTFVELEVYRRISSNVYFGVNVGSTFIDENIFDLYTADGDFYPLELNAKYAMDLGSNFVIDGGGGVSYSHAKIHIERLFSEDFHESDWLLGAQVFADLTYKIHWFSLGLYGKYQVTQDFKDLNADFSNWRTGLSIGVLF